MEPFTIGMISLIGVPMIVSILGVWRVMIVRRNRAAERDAMFVKIQNTCPHMQRRQRGNWCTFSNRACDSTHCLVYFTLKFKWPTPPVNHEQIRREGRKEWRLRR